jgi:hypothetical protein
MHCSQYNPLKTGGVAVVVEQLNNRDKCQCVCFMEKKVFPVQFLFDESNRFFFMLKEKREYYVVFLNQVPNALFSI